MISKVLGNLSKGLLFVMSAPAGTGKTTLAKLLIDEFSCVRLSISCTTRAPRGDEIDGKDYHFLTVEEFEKRIRNGDFLEYAKVFGHYYGTSREFVQKELRSGHHVILVIDTQGALQIKSSIPAIFIFVSPPSLNELKMRLSKRKTEEEHIIQERLSWAKHEIESAKFYDYNIINQDLKIAYQVLRSILIAEEHRIRNG